MKFDTTRLFAYLLEIELMRGYVESSKSEESHFLVIALKNTEYTLKQFLGQLLVIEKLNEIE